MPPPPPPARILPAALAGLAGGVAGALAVAAALGLFSAGTATDRIARIEAGLGEKATRAAQEAVEKRVAAVETAAQGLRTDVEAARRPAPPPDLGPQIAPLQERMQGLERAIAEARTRADAATAAANRPPPPPPPPSTAIGARESALLSVAVLTRDALARGAPYTRELAALKAAGADPALVAALEPFAAGGAPTSGWLAEKLGPAAEALAKAPSADPPGGVVDRLTAGLSRLYQVQPMGDAPGESPAAVAARAVAALKRGALSDAATALSALPASVPPEVKSVVDATRQRYAAAQAADTLVARAVDQVLAVTQSGGPAR